MRLAPRLLVTGLLVTVSVATVTPLAAQTTTTRPATQRPAVKTEWSRSELETEQRIMRAHIKDAEFNITRGISAVGSDLAESAKVSVLRGSARIAQAEDILKSHLVRIEKLSFSLLYSRENERKRLRAELDKVRRDFANAEDSLYALQRDMLRKGIFGEELKRQIAILDAVPKIISDLEAKDPAKAAEVRALVEQINEALASGDTARAGALIKQLNDLLRGAGYGSAIEAGVAEINASAGGAAPNSGSGGSLGAGTESGQAPAGPREISRRTLPDGSEEVVTEQTVTNPDGSRTVTRLTTVTRPDGSKDVTTTTERYDPSGNLIGRDSQTQSYDANGRPTGTTSLAGGKLTVVGPDGSQQVISISADGTSATAYQRRYIGGQGAVLTAEREVTYKLRFDANGAFQGADPTPGEQRSWDFVIEEVEGTRQFANDGSMQTKLIFKDNKLKTDYTLSGWSITNPTGREVGKFGAQDEVSAKFTESGKHTLTVTGQTDWGSPFKVTVDLDVAL